MSITTISSLRESRFSYPEQSDSEDLILELPLVAENLAIVQNADEREERRRLLEALDPEEKYYAQQLANKGGTLHRTKSRASNSETSWPHSISWKLYEKAQFIKLQPCDIVFDQVSRSKQKLLRSIIIQLPIEIQHDCIVITEDEGENLIVIDFIAENGVFYTVALGFNQFYSNAPAIVDPATWRSIKTIPNIDLRNVHLLHAVSSRILVASFTDGSLVKLSRSTSLDHLSSTSFHDSTYGLSFSRILPWSGNDRVPGNHHISLRTIISMDSLPRNDLLVTVSINKHLKIWSLNSLTVLEDLPLDPDNPSYLSVFPIRLLSIATRTQPLSKSQSTYLATCLPIHESKINIWQLNTQPESGSMIVALQDIQASSISLQAPDNDSNWLIPDFKLLSNEATTSSKKSSLELYVLWKSHNSSVIQSTTFPISSIGGDIIWNTTTQTFNSTAEDSFRISNPLGDRTDDFLRKIFGPYGYAAATIKAAIPIFTNFYGMSNNISSSNPSDVSLADQVCKVVGEAVVIQNAPGSGLALDYHMYTQDVNIQWLRFDRLCTELEAQGNEAHTIDYDTLHGVLWITKAQYTSIIRPSLEPELYFSNLSSSPSVKLIEALSGLTGRDKDSILKVLKFSDILQTLKKSIPHYALSETISAFVENYSHPPVYLTEERMAYIYNNTICAHISETVLYNLDVSLNDLGNIDDVLGLLFECLSCSNIDQNQQQHSEPLSPLGSILLSNMLFEFDATCRQFVVLILISIVHATTLKSGYIAQLPAPLFSKYLGLFKAFMAVQELGYIQNRAQVKEKTESKDAPDGIVEDLSNVVKKLSFVEPIFSDMPFLASLDYHSQGSLSDTITKFWSFLNISGNNESIASYIVMKLLQSGHQVEALNFLNYLPSDSFATFVKAQAHLISNHGEKAVVLFRSSSGILSRSPLNIDQLQILEDFSSMYQATTFNSGLAVYFEAVAAMALSYGHPLRALELCRDAVNNIRGTEANEAAILVPRIYSLLFTCALKSLAFDDAYAALTELYLVKSDLPNGVLEQNISILVDDMCQKGHGVRMCQYPFIGMTDLVSQHLESKARETVGPLKSSQAISYFKLLYAWKTEHNDYRGGEYFEFRCNPLMFAY